MPHEINMKTVLRRKNLKMVQKFYQFGDDRLPMKVLKNLHEVIDFVNPRNENLRQSTIRQRIISALEKGILYPGAKPDLNRWKSIVNKKDRITVTQRIERQPQLRKHLNPKGNLRPKSVIAKYYRLRKKGKLPTQEENPPKICFQEC